MHAIGVEQLDTSFGIALWKRKKRKRKTKRKRKSGDVTIAKGDLQQHLDAEFMKNHAKANKIRTRVLAIGADVKGTILLLAMHPAMLMAIR
jgi:hypothetical protein